MGVTIVQKGLRIWFSITAVYQVSSRTSLVIINSGKRGISDRILADFQRCLSEAWIPALLPVLVIENIMSEYEREIRGSFERLNRVRSAIGISPYSTTRASDELDLLQQSVELTYLAQLFAAMDNQLSTLAANVATVARFHESFCTSLRSLAIDAKQEAILEIHERLEHAKRHVQTRLEWNVLSNESALTGKQVYSMIGNRDNILNFRAAQASVRIAELARKDSSDMRIIAAVTLLFLPATFVAVGSLAELIP
ncbi:MAG: hypothetical protein M1820_008595 [Bogoriella megaspora]|nr:MAG: hypothetical protein M1820_008595 [Bogoriella megaspora]